MTPDTTAHYQHVGFYLLRAPALPADVFTTVTNGPDVAITLDDMAATASIRRALEAASPSLAAEIGRPRSASDGKRERVRSSLLRYITRMSTRPTPYGAFAGVAIGQLSESTTAQLGPAALGRQRIRADMGWLMAVVKQAQGNPPILTGLSLVWNALAEVVGERVVLPPADAYGQGERRAARILRTPAVHLVQERTNGAPAPYRSLVADLAAAFPGAGVSQLNGLLAELVDLGFLLTDLRPPLSDPHPEDHVINRLARLSGAASTAAAPLLGALRQVRAAARRAERGDADDLFALRTCQRALVPKYAGETYQLDAALDLPTADLSASVGDAAAEAVSCLARISSALPRSWRHLDAYSDAFVERYGAGALVPLTEVLNPGRGLGAPAGYLQPPPTAPPAPLRDSGTRAYDRVLSEAAADAWRNGAREIELTSVLEQRLVAAALQDRAEDDTTHGHGRTQQHPPIPGVDVYLQLQAADRTAITRGEWRAVLNAQGLAAGGCTFGRFTDLFTEPQRAQLRDYAQHRGHAAPHAAVVELSYMPSHGRSANVAVRSLHHDVEIAVNVPASASSKDRVTLDDIHLAADQQGLYLWSKQLGREIIVAEGHMLTAAAAPNVCRFLIEVSQARYLPVGSFSWAGLEASPHLPRVARGQVVLRPAEWTLTSDQLGSDQDFDTALGQWRSRWQTPQHVYLVEHDNRLLLDLDHPLCRQELARELRKGSVSLQEMLPALDSLWLRDAKDRGYLSEIIVPLVADMSGTNTGDQGRQPRTADRRSPRLSAASATRPRLLPGSPWSFVKLYSGFEQHDEILAGPLQEVAAELRDKALADRWFYIRYADPRPHLRIRFHATEPADSAHLLKTLLGWSRDLTERGLADDLTVASYEPEVVRYGGPEAYDAIERLFEAGSDCAIAIINRTWSGALEQQPEFTAVAALDALYAQWGMNVRERLDAVPSSGNDVPGARSLYREHRDYLAELLIPSGRRPHPEAAAHRAVLTPLFALQAAAVRDAAQSVRQAAAGGELWGSEASLLASLAHMTVNRLLPVELVREERAYAIWRNVLKMIGGRPE
ncbi:lantibiotic dehydratase [Streptomyces syringium]|uniref:lantibiotic dehydratase n=1 Tax=Streptomyces syringium TaxID=76729 RepID=UPI003400B19A